MGEVTGSRRRRHGARLAGLVAAAGGVWLALHVTGLLGDAGALTFPLLGATTLTATAIGVLRWRPRPRWPWLLILAALALFLLGGAARQALGTLGDLSEQRSLAPDALAIPGYVLLAMGFTGFARARRSRSGNLDATLDAGVAALAALALAWVYLIVPALEQQHAPLHLRVVLALYPAMSVFLLAILARLAFSPGSRHPLAYQVVLAAVGAMLVGDVVYMLVDLQLAAVPAVLVDLPYGVAYLAFAAAVLHPSMRELSEPLPAAALAPRHRRLLLVAGGLCVPALVTITRTETTGSDRAVLSFIVLALTGTVAYRMFRALRAHAESEADLTHRVMHDDLTGLPNRAALAEHLRHALADLPAEHLTALLFLDLDRFKLVNDTFGHTLGDELLVAAAQRLRRTSRDADFVARVGGDEFVVVIDDVAEEADARQVAHRARLALAVPFEVRGIDVPVTASVGVALGGAGDDPEELLRDGDTAMYQAKDAGGDAVASFDAAVRERLARRLGIEQALRTALARHELRVHYQPIVRIGSGNAIGLEALLRWESATLGTVGPDDFIPIAEDTGMITTIGAWVIDEACRTLAQLRDAARGAHELRMSVNLSPRQLRDDSLADHVARSLVRHGLPAEVLCLELTESAVMDNVARSSRTLDALRSFGVRIAIDDFGTGYSSLAYLKDLPVDLVKIDRSFVRGLRPGTPDASLVAAVVAIADSLGIETVAEGVETAEEVAALEALGCAGAQGYHFAHPVAPDALAEVLVGLGVPHEPRLRVVRDPA